MEREVKGIWIPIEVWEDENLTWNEKILFMEIDSFTSKDKDCFFSNEYIAELLKCTETSANRVLSSLIKKGYVVKTKFDGRHRFVKTAYSYNNSQSKADLSQESKQGCHKRQGRVVTKDNIINTNNKTNNNHKESKENSRPSSGFFDYENGTKALSSVEEKKENVANATCAQKKEERPYNIEEIHDYFKQKGFRADEFKFWNYYQARGWEGIKDWKALADLWEMREKGVKVQPRGEKKRDTEYEEFIKKMEER